MSDVREVLEIKAVGRAAWRICDSRRPASDALRVLGFVERKRGRFEVMRVSHGFDWQIVDGFDEAIGFFEALVEDGDERDEHPLAELQNAMG